MNTCVEQQLRLLQPFRNPIPARFRFDMAYVKMSRDIAYVQYLVDLLEAPDLGSSTAPHADFLCFAGPLIGDARTDLGWYGPASTVNTQLTVFADCRR